MRQEYDKPVQLEFCFANPENTSKSRRFVCVYVWGMRDIININVDNRPFVMCL